MTIEEALAQQENYYPSDLIARQLRSVTLLLFIGPAGVGKSTTLDLVADVDQRFGRTGSIGTRPPHTRDAPGMYQQYTPAALLQKIADRQVSSYTIHPTTGDIYGTIPSMFTNQFNMLECLPGAVTLFRRLPFAKLLLFYIVTEPSAWQTWFEARYPTEGAERIQRTQEAALSLEWALQQPAGSLRWIKNTPGAQEATAKQIIASVGNLPTTDYHQTAKNMVRVAYKLSGVVHSKVL